MRLNRPNSEVTISDANLNKAFSYVVAALITWIVTWAASAIVEKSWKLAVVGGAGVVLGGACLVVLWLYNNKRIRVDDYTSHISSWKASALKLEDERGLLPNPAGCTIRKLNLKRRWLKSISFTIKAPISSDKPGVNFHWRAGVVLSKDERLNESHLTNKNNILFHVGRNGIYPKGWERYNLFNTMRIITMYHGQDSRVSSPVNRGRESTPPNEGKEPAIREKEIKVKDNDEIELRFEVADPRFRYDISVSGYSGKTSFGDEEGQDRRDISEFLNNIFLVAWGDGEAYEVEFSDICYETFCRSNDWLEKEHRKKGRKKKECPSESTP